MNNTYLLSEKWENIFLNDMFNDGLMYFRRQIISGSEKQYQKMQYNRANPFYLVDHDLFKQFDTDTLVVKDEKRNIDIIFMLKDHLANRLNEQKITTQEDIVQIVFAQMKGSLKKARNDTAPQISSEDFESILEKNELYRVIEVLGFNENQQNTKKI